MGIFDKIISKVKSVVSPKLLDPRADKPEKPLNFDISNTKMPDGSTTNPSTVTGYNWARKYFPEANAPRLTKDSFGKVVPEIEKKITSPTLMPSNMKNVGIATTMTPKVIGIGTTKKQEMTPAAFYDGAEKSGAALGVPKEVILANSRWEHRNNKGWNEGKYNDNIWWNEEKNTGEESYGPGQINMRWFGPAAIKLGRITTDHPLYITPEQAKDPFAAAEWIAKKFSREAKVYTNKGLEPDWEAILQGYNSNEPDRGKNVKNLIDTTDFVRS
jgi:hypothetical protein